MQWEFPVAFFALLVIVIGVLSALALVVVGLVEMPWPMLLLGLVATLYGFQYLIEGNRVQEIGIAAAEPVAESIGREAPTTASPASFDDTASSDVLIYRGVRRPNSTPETPNQPSAEETADPATPQTDELVYRGVRYQVERRS